MTDRLAGKYVYCIVSGEEERNFGPVGIGGGQEVTTIAHGDLSAVASSSPLEEYSIKRENMLAHENVIARVFQEYRAVLPVRFNTVAAGVEEVRRFLQREAPELRRLLRAVDGRAEVGLQVFWQEMQSVFREIAEQDTRIKKLRDKVYGEKGEGRHEDKIRLGELVLATLLRKKAEEARVLLDALRPAAVDYRENKIYADQMVLNMSFLIDRAREVEFDNCLADLDREYSERYQFKRTVLMAPFNFSEIRIRGEAGSDEA